MQTSGHISSSNTREEPSSGADLNFDAEETRARFEKLKAEGLSLDMSRGQPGSDQFDLCNGLLTALAADDFYSREGLDCRNYPGGIQGLPEARELFAPLLGATPEQTIVGNNSSLELMQNLLMWAVVRGMPGGDGAWGSGAKFICPVPGYDRHFTVLSALGFEMCTVPMTEEGPDMEAVKKLVSSDKSIKGIWCVPRYSNPTGITYSDAVVDALASMDTAAGDFRIFWDDAYSVHHLVDSPKQLKNVLETCASAGNPDRVFVFGSTSKITFAGAGLGLLAMSKGNLEFLKPMLSSQTIGPDKINQLRHVRFFESYPGGIEGLMKKHAELVAPKFAKVNEVLGRELEGSGLATWTNPEGGYFSSLDTAPGLAKRVVELAGEAGVKLTPAGATYPQNQDPENRNIRIAPTRPTLDEVEKAMEVLAVCVKLAASEQV